MIAIEADDGTFTSDPEFFGSKHEAVEFAATKAAGLHNGEALVMYRVNQIAVLHEKQP